MDSVNITIIGGGIVGLAIAAALSRDKGGILLLERHETFGRETSSRNSEVVHAGIYYPPGTLKAGLCVSGARMLYRYCAENGVKYRRTGKLIVAAGEAEAEAEALTGLMANGIRNGVEGLSILDGAEVAAMEPGVIAHSALYSPNTGIVDSHGLMASLKAEAEEAGVMFSFGSEADSIEKAEGGYIVGVKGDDYRFRTDVVINSAGLSSDRVAGLAGLDVDAAGYRLRYCKGSYFSYAGRSPVGRLVYPVPHDDLKGLGVHATVDLAGRLRFGPDAEYVGEPEYRVDPAKRDVFYQGASRIIGGLERESFMPDMAGVRPKLAGEGVRDFVIQAEAERGLPGLVNLIGIESPGLTASLAIADYVSEIVAGAAG